MKNIHVLPTDNYSPLVYSTNKYGGLFLSKYYSPTKDMGDSYQHIYITSDEEIKFNVYCLINGVICKTELFENKIVSRQLTGGATMDICKSEYSEIILTTDQDLIKNSIQAIDDEFLEWFVNNPSFKGVEVIYGLYNPSGRKVNFEILNQNHSQCVWKYKIIIPNEEPKCQHPTRLREYYHKNAFKCFECNKIITSTDIINPKSNKETLEEVKVPIGEFIINNAVSIQGADGAYYHYSEVCKLLKLQSQRMCSEEDMIKFALFLEIHLPMKPRKTHHQLLEQFKTK